MQYSYFIKKNFDFIQDNGYLIYPNGHQLYKKTGNFEVLITDYTGEKIFFERLVLIDVWIKDSFTDIIKYRKIYKGSIFYPQMKRIERKINKKIIELERKRVISDNE